MAKDNITLLQDISNQLKRLNQDNVRSNLEEQKFRDMSLAQQAGAADAQAGSPAFIDPIEDFKRRLKGSTAGAIAAEQFTASGKRAKRQNKEAAAEKKAKKKAEKQADQAHLESKFGKKLKGIETKDKRIGISTIYNVIKETQATQVLQLDLWTQVFSDQLKRFKQERADRLDDKRAMIEDKNERREKVVDQTQPMLALPDPNDKKMPKKKSFLAKLAKMWMLVRALPYLIGAAAIGLATAAIKDFVDGWKADGLEGAIGKMLGGSGSGIWNAIKQSFKVGGLGAVIGGAIGFLFGGVGAIPGAIIGGLIGMAIGAVAGYFGGDRITAGLKNATKAVATGWNSATALIEHKMRMLGEWFYKPGQSNNPHHTGKSEIFGGFISWDPGNFSIAAAFKQGTDKIFEFASAIGKWIYDGEGEGATIMGGRFEMPAWFDKIELGVAKVWEGLKHFAGIVKSTLINMLPDWLTDQLGWTVNGKTPETLANENRAYNMNNPMHPANNKQNFYMKSSDGTMKTLAAIDAEKTYLTGNASLQAQIAGQKSMEETQNFNAVMFKAMKSYRVRTSPASDNRLAKVFSAIGQDENTMSDYLNGKKGGAVGSQFHSHTNTDASVSKGAVTVIQHLYSDGSPTKATMTIHDHMDLNYGMSYNGYN